jgi:hypothetical protein
MNSVTADGECIVCGYKDDELIRAGEPIDQYLSGIHRDEWKEAREKAEGKISVVPVAPFTMDMLNIFKSVVA